MGVKLKILVDQIGGKVVVDPDKDVKKEIHEISSECDFFRKPEYESVEYDHKLDEKLSIAELKGQLAKHCQVLDSKQCYIVYYKVEY